MYFTRNLTIAKATMKRTTAATPRAQTDSTARRKLLHPRAVTAAETAKPATKANIPENPRKRPSTAITTTRPNIT